jgi:hypothetical protein
MEALTRLVADSLARHGFDRPVDPRRLQWSCWFRCDSPHSLLVVPSKPGIFALAEEIVDFCAGAERGRGSYQAAASAVPPALREPVAFAAVENPGAADESLGGAALQRCDSSPLREAASAAENKRRMLAVLQFSEDDNMAYVLDRMFTHMNPMRSRLASGSCFLRFVVIEDQQQRRSICAALNQWMRSSAERATGLPADFSSSLETNVIAAARVDAGAAPVQVTVATLDSGASKNLHCPQPLPSGF